MYNPAIVNTALVDQSVRYVEPIVHIQEYAMQDSEKSYHDEGFHTRYHDVVTNVRQCGLNPNYTGADAANLPHELRTELRDARYVFGGDNPRCFDVRQSDVKYYDPQGARYAGTNARYGDVSARFAKLRLLDNTKLFESSKSVLEGSSRMLDSNKMFESTARMLENPQDTADRDTNNDSGYSTKVYGSSKGNSPSLSGQIDGDCLGASSLV